jgi:hypothetical protein
MYHVCANTAGLHASAAMGLSGRLEFDSSNHGPRALLEDTGLQSRPTTGLGCHVLKKVRLKTRQLDVSLLAKLLLASKPNL